MIILGIESSCDETSAAVLEDRKLLSNVVLTQEIHSKFGGVVPEIASREHEAHIAEIVETSLKRSGKKIGQLDGIAVTYGAGLLGALLVGLNFAKGLSVGLNVPYLAVNHMEGHLFANFIDNQELEYPFLCLLVSGGHTQIWDVKAFRDYELISNSIDDAAGEAFDKGARILGLAYPGGPEIERIAKSGTMGKYHFPIPRIKESPMDFSFSGLKTALLYKYRDLPETDKINEIPNLAINFQETIFDTILDRVEKALLKTKRNALTVAGGVAVNQQFRKKTELLQEKFDTAIHFPPLQYCTDNAGMIAMAGYERMRHGEFSQLSQNAFPALSLSDNFS